MPVSAFPKARSTRISAVVTRADGRVENLGMISYWHRNPLLRYPVNAWIWLRRTLLERSR